MSGVGGVSGAGNAVGAGSSEPVASNSSNIESGLTSEETPSHGAVQSSGHNMSTQSFIELHNTAITQVNEIQSSDIDLKKLIEMMIAIELLKAMDEQ